MTNEEAKRRMKICRDFLANNYSDMGEPNFMAFNMAIKALGQTDVLDKVRAEIESCREDEEPHLCDYRYHRNEGLDMALDIIDKYKAESEGAE